MSGRVPRTGLRQTAIACSGWRSCRYYRQRAVEGLLEVGRSAPASHDPSEQHDRRRAAERQPGALDPPRSARPPPPLDQAVQRLGGLDLRGGGPDGLRRLDLHTKQRRQLRRPGHRRLDLGAAPGRESTVSQRSEFVHPHHAHEGDTRRAACRDLRSGAYVRAAAPANAPVAPRETDAEPARDSGAHRLQRAVDRWRCVWPLAVAPSTERAEIDAIDRVEDLAADACGEEILGGEVCEGNGGRGVRREVDVELPEGVQPLLSSEGRRAAAPGAKERRRGGSPEAIGSGFADPTGRCDKQGRRRANRFRSGYDRLVDGGSSSPPAGGAAPVDCVLGAPVMRSPIRRCQRVARWVGPNRSCARSRRGRE
jgi:hypothetical protein